MTPRANLKRTTPLGHSLARRGFSGLGKTDGGVTVAHRRNPQFLFRCKLEGIDELDAGVQQIAYVSCGEDQIVYVRGGGE